MAYRTPPIMTGNDNPAKRPEVRKKISDSKMGSKNSMWNLAGRQLNRDGYLLRTDEGWRPEARTIMEKVLCRKLDKNERVLHLNKDNTDNSPSNLKVITTKESGKILGNHPNSRWNKNLSKYDLPGIMSQSRKLKVKWLDEDFKNETIRRMRKGYQSKPNRIELVLDSYLQIVFPDSWEYVGDGKLVIGGKIPDFVNYSSRSLIELFGSYWHTNQQVNERIEHFLGYGWRCIVIWDYELGTHELKNKILNYIEGETSWKKEMTHSQYAQ